MTDSYQFFAELKEHGHEMSVEEYAEAFSRAVAEFCCFQRGGPIAYILKIVRDCDFDHKKVIRIINEQVSEKRGKKSDKDFKLVFEGDDDQ